MSVTQTNFLNPALINKSPIIPQKIDLTHSQPEDGMGKTANTVKMVAFAILLAAAAIVAGALVGLAVSAVIAACVCAPHIIALGVAIGAGIGFIAAIAVSSVLAHNRYKNIPYTLPAWKPKHGTPPIPLNQTLTNNRVLATKDSAETTRWKLDLMRSAEHSIELSGSYCGGKPFQDALAIIEERLRAKPRLKVRIIAAGSMLERADRSKLRQLEQTWPSRFHCLTTDMKFRAFTDPDSSLPLIHTVENHVKVLVVDEKYVVIGGSNLQTNLCGAGDAFVKPSENASMQEKMLHWMGHTRDMDVVMEGPEIAKTFRWQFYRQVWGKWATQMQNEKALKHGRYFPVTKRGTCQVWEQAEARIFNKVPMKALASELGEPNSITSEIVDMLATAKKTIYVANLACSPQPKLHEALVNAAANGKRIIYFSNWPHDKAPSSKKLFPGNGRALLPIMIGSHDIPSDATLDDLRSRMKDVTYFAYNVPNTMLHHKVWTTDERVIIGSNNASWRSEYSDDEFAVSMTSPDLAKTVQETIKQDIIERSEKVQLSEVHSAYKSFSGLIAKKLSPLQCWN